MSEAEAETKALSGIGPEDTETPATGKATSAAEPRSRGGFIPAILLSLVAIGIAAYPAYETYREKRAPNPAPLPATAPDRTALADLTESVKALGTEHRRVKEELDNFSRSTNDEIAEIKRSAGSADRDWLLAEAEYLIRMAGQRLLLERDITSALRLLEAADRLAKEAGGLASHGLRQALAKDIAALRLAKQVDTQGIYLEIAALMDRVPDLKRRAPGVVADSAEEVEEEEEVVGEPSFMSRLADRFTDLVDFRRGDIEINPVLPPAEEYYLRQNLVLKLQLAQIAALSANRTLFEASLRDAADWVVTGFDKGDAATLAMAESLLRLSGIDIAATPPDISASLHQARSPGHGVDPAETSSP